MAALDDETYGNYTDNDDLEKALVLAAADADARSSEATSSHHNHTSPKSESSSSSSSSSSDEEETTPEPDPEPPRQSGLKRKLENDVTPTKATKLNESLTAPETIEGNAKVVARHYNTLAEKGLDERSKSRIFHMRNFHNWIKSMLINEYLTKIKNSKKHNAPIRVHDMCCGKGGDLLKWRKGNINHLICSDIAAVSLDQCKTRYQDMKNRNFRDRNSGSIYTIEYIAADCTRVRLREKYQDVTMKLDLVSCQFAFHYSFESIAQAECMLKNAAECLQPGGFFIGTMPDANELMARIHKSRTNSFGNNVYNVNFDCHINKPPLFGAKYNFQLDGVVNCPEFLVHFPTLVKLAKKFGLKLVKCEKFADFYERMKYEGKYLLGNMKSLEPYPPQDGNELVGTDAEDYLHAEEFLRTQERSVTIGTLSKSEWEASSIYLTFVFEKVKNTWNALGEPVYDI